tara:strand:+ start:2643 stop:3251 length:609 start_codon:yes stop_codon:yes gene_type:complete
MILIRDGNVEDLTQIVSVHKKSFDGFFLTLLGDSFLQELYRGFIESSLGAVRVAYNNNGDIVGFSAGTYAPELFFKRLRTKKGWKFILLSIPCFFSNPVVVLRKIYTAAFYKGDGVKSLPQAALLSSIAVDPQFSGQSIGKELLIDFERNITSLENCEYIYLITDRKDNQRVIQFYLSAGYVREAQFLQSGGRKMLRLIKKI